MAIRHIIALALLIAIVAFLVGFVPQFLENRRLRSEIETNQAGVNQLRTQAEVEAIRNLAGKTLLQTLRQNYGNAAELSTQYFNKVQELMRKTENPALQSSLSELMKMRDSITSGLAQGNPTTLSELQALLQRSYELPDAVPQ
jgi:hypothetical protein